MRSSNRRLPSLLAVAALLVAARVSGAQTTSAATQGYATVRGLAVDSIRQRPLAQAVIAVEGTTRIGFSDGEGNYRIDSVPPGSHRISLSHPMLDTLGLVVMTNPLVMRGGEFITVDLATPSPARVVSMRCPAPVLQLRGPAAVMGQVTDPDSMKAAIGSRVQLVYEETILGFKGKPVVRETQVDSSGGYRICGLPTPLSGKLQVFRNGVSSGQVDIDVTGPLGMRSLSIAAPAVSTSDSGPVRNVVVGNSRLTGRVVTKAGNPIQSARVSIEGSASVVLTNARGEFTLDSLPSGTQSLEVRKIGYASSEVAVELNSRAPTTTTVTLDVAELAPVRIVAGAEKALGDLGYLERKKQGMGHFIDGDAVQTQAMRFTDALRTVPGLRIVPAGNGRSVIQNARDPSSGCVNVFVDNVRWREVVAGDIDDFVHPSEVGAIESYSSNTVPGKFETAGMSKCATVVVWTTRYLDRRGRKK